MDTPVARIHAQVRQSHLYTFVPACLFSADVVVCHGHLISLLYLQTPRQWLGSNVIPRGNICWPVRADLLVSATIRILRVGVDVKPRAKNTSPGKITCCVEAIEIAKTLSLLLFQLTAPCV